MDVNTNTQLPLGLRDELRRLIDSALPKNPAQLAEQLIREKWGAALDPQTTQLVTLHYDYWLRAEPDGSHVGHVALSQSLVQVLLSNYQTVGDGRFGESAFGFYTPPDVGPVVRLMQAPPPTDDHRTYEGIYRHADPQVYEPQTQLDLRPADFKQWVWQLFFDERYQAYVDITWPSDETILGSTAYDLRTSTKAAFVMSAWLQHREHCLSDKGMALAMSAAGLAPGQTWGQLTMAQLQASTRLTADIQVSRLKIYRYIATDIWCYCERSSGRLLMYIPGNSSPLHEFIDARHLRRWIVAQGKADAARQALAAHFAEEDRRDGTFHAGVVTALEGLAIYPQQHRLGKEAGFFNNDGYWDPADYIGFELPPKGTDPFAQLVLSMKQAAQASVKTIRSDAQVNRDNLSAVVEPIVQWANRFGPLALFVPGGEGVLALMGLIDAGVGLDQALEGQTASERSQGVVRTVFGLLNALPLAVEVASLGREGTTAGESLREPGTAEVVSDPILNTAQTRTDLLSGIVAPLGTFSEEVLSQIAKVSDVGNDMLRVIQAGRPPTPMLADTLARFRLDQEVAGLTESAAARSQLFNRRYQAMQTSEHEGVRLFQRQYPDLPSAVVEQMFDRCGFDFTAAVDGAQAKRLFKQLDGKARQYQQHVRLNRVYEGLYLRSIVCPETDILALHSLESLPGWPKGVRIEIHDGFSTGRVLDRIGPLDTLDCRRLIKVAQGYQPFSLSPSGAGAANLYDAVAGVLSPEERTVLSLPPEGAGNELRLRVGRQPLPRPALALGLGRMDSGLPFEAQGLRGGGYPDTPQGRALTHAMMQSQIKDLYPTMTREEIDALLLQLGGTAQAYIDRTKQQFLQLYEDLEVWLERVAVDIDDMDVHFLHMGDPGTAGMTDAELAQWNAQRVQDTIDYERDSRGELGDELIAILQKRAPEAGSHYSGNATDGFTMDMNNEDFHCLPSLNIRFNDVIGLKMQNLQMIDRESLDGFLEAFPNLRTLTLEKTDLRIADATGVFRGAVPSTIAQLQHLTSLNLRLTHLTFSEDNAGLFSSLVNLQSLDLSDNPLAVPPVVIGMDQLQVLRLNNTGIDRCPIGIRDQPHMTLLDLRNNRIRRVPQAILNQAISRDRVLLWNNPITDQDTLHRLVLHRRQTGLNLWLSSPSLHYSEAAGWLDGIEGGQREARLQLWQRLLLKPRGNRFLAAINALTLTADFQISYLELQTRVWELLSEADASHELWRRLTQGIPVPTGIFDNPYSVFSALEDRARVHRDWVALGRPFPVEPGEP
ncbi:leucine-rich repeat domain-containing protein [Pseudomonas sp. S2_C03]